MYKTFLLPHCCKRIGWFMLVPFLIMSVLEFAEIAPIIKIPVFNITDGWEWFSVMKDDVYMEIWIIDLCLSLMFIALSKEKEEDEMIMQVRLQSMLFSLWCTSIWFVVETLFLFGMVYAYSLWATLYVFLVIFIGRFRYELRRLNQFEK